MIEVIALVLWAFNIGLLVGHRSGVKSMRHAATIGEPIISAIRQVSDTHKFIGAGDVRNVCTYARGAETFEVTVRRKQAA